MKENKIDSYPWTLPAWEQLCALRVQERLPHALLLQGPAGLGKAALALRFAWLCLCHDPGAREAACGACRACRLTRGGTHPDLVFVEPEADKTSISVTQVRSLIHDLSLHSHLGGAKVALIRPAEAMTLNAANSLLKTLEEPPSATVLVLVTSRPSRLPPTVLSRCQTVRLHCPPPADALGWLRERKAGADWPVLLELAGGAPLEASRLADLGFEELARELGEELRAICEGTLAPITAAGRWVSRDRQACLAWLYHVVAGMIRHKSLGPNAVPVHSNLASFMQSFVTTLDLPPLFQYLEAILQGIASLEGQANPRLVFESLLLPWAGRLGAIGQMANSREERRE